AGGSRLRRPRPPGPPALARPARPRLLGARFGPSEVMTSRELLNARASRASRARPIASSSAGAWREVQWRAETTEGPSMYVKIGDVDPMMIGSPQGGTRLKEMIEPALAAGEVVELDLEGVG